LEVGAFHEPVENLLDNDVLQVQQEFVQMVQGFNAMNPALTLAARLARHFTRLALALAVL
jgi:hypothetical protein